MVSNSKTPTPNFFLLFLHLHKGTFKNLKIKTRKNFFLKQNHFCIIKKYPNKNLQYLKLLLHPWKLSLSSSIKASSSPSPPSYKSLQNLQYRKLKTLQFFNPFDLMFLG
jgi:hypothetical protein